MIFPAYLVIQAALWFISGGKWSWLLKNTEIFMILSSVDSYYAADLVGVFDRFVEDLVRGILYPNRDVFIRRKLVALQDNIIRTSVLAVVSLLIDHFLV